MNPLPPTPLTVKQAAAALGYSIGTVYNLIKYGHIEAICYGKTKRIPVAAVQRFIEKYTEPATAQAPGPYMHPKDFGPSYRGPASTHKPKPPRKLPSRPTVRVAFQKAT
jgi:excisionase family DNA binding protein